VDIEEVREFCLSVKGAGESMPFDDKTVVFKVMGKMFAYLGLERRDDDFWLSLKCDPERSMELRERYPYIRKAHYAGDTYLWNTVCVLQTPDAQLKELILHSRDEVIRKLSRKKQEEYRNME
jgi:predicted DNA-binding protein (MmcQ/YjbR family)